MQASAQKRFSHHLLSALIFSSVSASAFTLQEMQRGFQPVVTEMPAMRNKPEAFSGVVKVPGLKAGTWVRFPLVQNPGSFGIDHQGRIYVAEVNRLWQGVGDLRGLNEFIRGDFRSRTLEDRLKLQNSRPDRVPEGFWTKTADRLIRLEDSDANEAADKRTVFADSFHQPLDGMGFSVLPEDDAVYFTCIPSLRKLTDTNDDGIADTNESLLTGFGVRVSFIGHDLHGIVRGPDGRLYFSIGDRGFHVTAKEGKVLAEGGKGAIFRCESDGSGLEVFCKGLRNPTELAFDEHGNLFTFDNTGDIGDRARMVYALEGTDSGWDMSHQCAHQYVDHMDWEDFHPKVSVWVAEDMFDTEGKNRPQWVYPPMANVARGPSGVTWLTGDTLPEALRGKFLLADYGGAPQSCKVTAYGVKGSGAGFSISQKEVLVEGVGASDVEQGYDGSIYICDFGGGWMVNGNGAIHKVTPEDAALQKKAQSMAAAFRRGLAAESPRQLGEALESPDRRWRQLAQFALVKHGSAGLPVLLDAANKTDFAIPSRLHGVWGLGQLARQKNTAAITALLDLSKDPEAEIRANAARVLGDLAADAVQPRLREMLADTSPRVRSLAVIALSRVSKTGDPTIVQAIQDLAKANNGSDMVLRHACATALNRLGTIESASALCNEASTELRLLAVLQLRHQQSVALARFLNDDEPTIRDEVIRAIYDTAALDTEAGDALAHFKPVADMPLLVQRRIVCASYRRGDAALLLQHAANVLLDASVREASLHGLRLWEKKITADPVLGGFRPIPGASRSRKNLGGVIGSDLKQFLANSPPPNLATLALKLADDTGVSLDAATLSALVKNRSLQPSVRVAALDSLVKSTPDIGRQLTSELLADSSTDGDLVASSLGHGLTMKLPDVIEKARRQISGNSLTAARAAIEVIAALRPAEAKDLWTQRESSGLRKELWLDVFLALQSSPDTAAQQSASAYAGSAIDAVPKLGIHGGDAKQGESVFRNQGACLQCHKIGRDGGVQGPALDLVAERLKPEKLVESLVNPNAEIAQGYGMSSVTLTDGTLTAGRIAEDTPERLSVIGMDGKTVVFARDRVRAVTPPVSAMPPMALSLPPKMLRDLLAYLRTRDRTTSTKQSTAAHGDEHEEVVK